MSTRISSLSIRTTVPSTTSPCLKLLMSESCSASSSSIVVGSGPRSRGAGASSASSSLGSRRVRGVVRAQRRLGVRGGAGSRLALGLRDRAGRRRVRVAGRVARRVGNRVGRVRHGGLLGRGRCGLGNGASSLAVSAAPVGASSDARQRLGHLGGRGIGRGCGVAGWGASSAAVVAARSAVAGSSATAIAAAARSVASSVRGGGLGLASPVLLSSVKCLVSPVGQVPRHGNDLGSAQAGSGTIRGWSVLVGPRSAPSWRVRLDVSSAVAF